MLSPELAGAGTCPWYDGSSVLKGPTTPAQHCSSSAAVSHGLRGSCVFGGTGHAVLAGSAEQSEHLSEIWVSELGSFKN